MSKEFKIGIAVLYAGVLISVNPWFWFFTWIIIISGIIRIKKSPETLKRKLIWSIIPFICLIPLVVLFYEIFMKYKM